MLPHSAIDSDLPCISFNIFKFVGQVKVIFKGFFVVGNQMMYDLEHGYGMIFYQEETGSKCTERDFYQFLVVFLLRFAKYFLFNIIASHVSFKMCPSKYTHKPKASSNKNTFLSVQQHVGLEQYGGQ